MRLKTILIAASCFIMLAGCNHKSMDNTLEFQNNNQGMPLTKLKTNSPVDQNPANRAKELLSSREEVKHVRAVNYDHQLMIGVQLKHHDRFNMDKIERRLQKEMNKEFSDLKVSLSTDEKIHLEIEKLEKAMETKQISKKKLKEKVKEIKSLSEEET